MTATAESVPRKFTYADLANFPDDHLRREIIDGRLFVTPSPSIRHQGAQAHVFGALYNYAEAHGGKAFSAPCDVHFDNSNTVEPDVFYLSANQLSQLKENFLEGAPELVVEVSSPSTRRVDLSEKLALYERFAVPNYWFVDLKSEQILVYVLEGDFYGDPTFKVAGDLLGAPHLPGLEVNVAKVLGA